ncbi:hypothetical protein Hamer_G031676 [Homarus americanus]|uniref:Uncharacterized protein n=1 Tax=Homarus americanus TaxID=6706 RepID=A0A8J5MU21_HOMAM|nr:hypothetical protein Hamer_G031676 [Homarus americanus]
MVPTAPVGACNVVPSPAAVGRPPQPCGPPQQQWEAACSHVVPRTSGRPTIWSPYNISWGCGLQPCGPLTSPVGRQPTTMWSPYNTSVEAAYNHVVSLEHQRGGGLQPCGPLQHQRDAAYNHVIPLQHQWGGGLQPCGPLTTNGWPTTMWSPTTPVRRPAKCGP